MDASESPVPAGPAPSREDTRTRDELARLRTVLANERTLLAYVRTAVALLLAGASSLHFLEGPVAGTAGLVLLGLGCLCVAAGALRFRQTARRLGRST